MKRWIWRVIIALAVIAGGYFSMHVSRSFTPYFVSADAEGVFGSLTSADDGEELALDFTTKDVLETFHVYVLSDTKSRPYTVVLTGEPGPLMEITRTGPMRCTVGKELPPGAYRLVLRPSAGEGEIVALIADRPVGLTGWQLLSRGLVGLLVVTVLALRVAAVRGSEKQRKVAARVCRHMAFAVLFIFLYLLLHEGGHALASASFGRFSLARSDFWGLSGSPHSGVRADVTLAPWQRAAESIAGPMLPIVTSWLMFLWWRSGPGRQSRERHHTLDFMVSGLITGFSVTAIIFPGFAMGLLSDGDWRGFADHTGVVTRQLLAWGTFLIAGTVFVGTVSHAYRVWRGDLAGQNSSVSTSRLEPG